MNIRIYLSIIVLLVSINAAVAQTTAFIYQGKLTDGANLANGNYDFEFRLFDALSGGTQQGATVQLLNVSVTNGSFTVQLDFGNQFTGANRFLDIGVKAASERTFTLLSPRQQVTSNPYAIKSLSATAADGLSVACVNCVTSSQIQSVNGSAVTGQIPVASVPAGSASYVQNTTSQQTSSNFNISGNGTLGGVLSANSAAITNTASANIFDATTQYNIGGSRAFTLSSFSRNVFAGGNAGAAGGIGGSNSFFGHGAGELTTTGTSNSFFGKNAGNANTASNNSFFGADAGFGNTSGTRNAFFGLSAGRNNQTGSDNAFFGYRAGLNSTASFNSFFGSSAGDSTTTGTNNTFFGYNAGTGNFTGSGNSFFGTGAGQANTADGNSFFGFHAGFANTTGTSNAFFGDGAGASNTTGANNTYFGSFAGLTNSTGFNNSFFGAGAGRLTINGDNSFFGFGAGGNNSLGNQNAFFGSGAGAANNNGGENAFFGSNAGGANTDGNANSFFGNDAGASNLASHNSFFGFAAGTSNTTSEDNSFFGYQAGQNTTGGSNTFIGSGAGKTATIGANNVFIGAGTGFLGGNTNGSNNTLIGENTFIGGSGFISFATAIGSGASVSSSHEIVLGTLDDTVKIFGDLALISPPSGGSINLCWNSTIVGICSSSLRYKTSVRSFSGGLDIVRRLRPITFTWKAGGMQDVGFAAEEVEKIEPLLATYNKGQIEGVKYGQITTVLVNAVKEQQAQIETQQQQLRDREQQAAQQQQQLQKQQQELAVLKQWYCRAHRKAALCQAAPHTRR